MAGLSEGLLPKLIHVGALLSPEWVCSLHAAAGPLRAGQGGGFATPGAAQWAPHRPTLDLQCISMVPGRVRPALDPRG